MVENRTLSADNLRYSLLVTPENSYSNERNMERVCEIRRPKKVLTLCSRFFAPKAPEIRTNTPRAQARGHPRTNRGFRQ